MTNHPITPPPELVEQWRRGGPADAAVNNAYERHIATQAAHWGADQELEACCEWIGSEGLAGYTSRELRAARRPKPPSLKEQALEALSLIPINPELGVRVSALDTIRRALEQLDD